MDRPDQQQDHLLRQAFELRTALVAYARSLLGSHSAAEDAVQEAMLVVVRKIEQFEEGTSMLAWCRAIVRIEVLRAKQRSQKERSLAERLLDDAVHAAFEEVRAEREAIQLADSRDALQQCLEGVPDRGRRVLDARYVDDLAYEQIGQVVGMSLEAVRKTLYRVKKQLRACVETRLRGV